jgi:hypothetical protein
VVNDRADARARSRAEDWANLRIKICFTAATMRTPESQQMTIALDIAARTAALKKVRCLQIA